MSVVPQAATQAMTITGIIRLAQDIFPEISAHAWSTRRTPDGLFWVLEADFNRTLRMEIVLNQNEWAVCQLVVRKEPFARTEEETERVVIPPTKDNFIGWFSDVRSRFPLPHQYMIVRGFTHPFRAPSGTVFTVDKDYRTIRFPPGETDAATTPDKLREWLAEGFIIQYYDYANPCRGCAVEYINCGMKIRNDPNATRECHHLHNVPKSQQPDRPTDQPKPKKSKPVTMEELWDKPPEPTGVARNVPCGRCQHGRGMESSTGDWDWHCAKANYPQRDCDDFEPRSTTVPLRPNAQCSGCRNRITGQKICQAGEDQTAPGHCAAEDSGPYHLKTEPNCKDCKHYDGPTRCKKDEALGTAPICLEFEAKVAEGSTRKKDQCLKCAHGIKYKPKVGDWSARCQRGENPEKPSPCPLFDSMFVNRRI